MDPTIVLARYTINSLIFYLFFMTARGKPSAKQLEQTRDPAGNKSQPDQFLRTQPNIL